MLRLRRHRIGLLLLLTAFIVLINLWQGILEFYNDEDMSYPALSTARSHQKQANGTAEVKPSALIRKPWTDLSTKELRLFRKTT